MANGKVEGPSLPASSSVALAVSDKPIASLNKREASENVLVEAAEQAQRRPLTAAFLRQHNNTMQVSGPIIHKALCGWTPKGMMHWALALPHKSMASQDSSEKPNDSSRLPPQFHFKEHIHLRSKSEGSFFASSFDAKVFSSKHSPWRYLQGKHNAFIQIWNDRLSGSIIHSLGTFLRWQLLAVSAFLKPKRFEPSTCIVPNIEVAIALEASQISATYIPLSNHIRQKIQRTISAKAKEFGFSVIISYCEVITLADPWLLDINERYQTVFRTRDIPIIPRKSDASYRKRLQRFSWTGRKVIKWMRTAMVRRAKQKKRMKERRVRDFV